MIRAIAVAAAAAVAMGVTETHMPDAVETTRPVAVETHQPEAVETHKPEPAVITVPKVLATTMPKAVAARACEDVSTNCWEATHYASRDYCTNSSVCPTCGDYMAKNCRATCAAYIEGCGHTPTPPPGDCKDVSTNCWTATHHGSRAYCTNSRECPTCGDYMARMCRKTCAEFIEGCDLRDPEPHPQPHPDGDFSDDLAFCYVANKYYENPKDSHNLIATLKHIPSMKACLTKCAGNKACSHASFKGEKGYCYLYVKDMGMHEAPRHEKYVSGSTTCDKCHVENAHILTGRDKTVKDIKNTKKCQKECDKEKDCAYISYEAASKTCELFSTFKSERGEEKHGWVTEMLGCEEFARALFFEEVTAVGTAQGTVVGVAMLAVVAFGYHTYSKNKSVLKEPLLGEA